MLNTCIRRDPVFGHWSLRTMKNCIRGLRTEKNYRQEDLANVLGVTRQTINAIENNKYDPTLLLAFKLANVFDTTVDKLFEPNPELLK